MLEEKIVSTTFFLYETSKRVNSAGNQINIVDHLGSSKHLYVEVISNFGNHRFIMMQENKFLKFLSFMWNPLSWVMEAAAIMAIVLANGGVSRLYLGTNLTLVLLLESSLFIFFLSPAQSNKLF